MLYLCWFELVNAQVGTTAGAGYSFAFSKMARIDSNSDVTAEVDLGESKGFDSGQINHLRKSKDYREHLPCYLSYHIHDSFHNLIEAQLAITGAYLVVFDVFEAD